MKKFILILILFVSISFSYAQPIHFTTTAFTARNAPEGVWEDWKAAEISGAIDLDKNQIWILSQENQRFYFSKFSFTEFDTGVLYATPALDKNGTLVLVELYAYNSGLWILQIKYANVEYKYKLKIE